MNKLTLAAAASLLMLAVPAFAQTMSTNGANAPTSAIPGSTSGTATQTPMAQVRERITHELEQNGFTNVRVVPDSFLVHAQNKDGEPMVMIINPDSVFGMTEVGAGNQTNSSASSAGQGNSGASVTNTTGTNQ